MNQSSPDGLFSTFATSTSVISFVKRFCLDWGLLAMCARCRRFLCRGVRHWQLWVQRRLYFWGTAGGYTWLVPQEAPVYMHSGGEFWNWASNVSHVSNVAQHSDDFLRFCVDPVLSWMASNRRAYSFSLWHSPSNVGILGTTMACSLMVRFNVLIIVS